MRESNTHSKWLLSTTILVMGMVLGLGFFAGATYAQDSTTSSPDGLDIFAPMITRVDAVETSSSTETDLDAEFYDLGTDIEPQADSIVVPDATVWGCQGDNRRMKCKSSNLRSGEHTMKVSVKDKAGNRSEREGKFTVRDTAAPVIDSIVATPSNVTVKYHDPKPSSGIESVAIKVDGKELMNCGSGKGGCSKTGDAKYEGAGPHTVTAPAGKVFAGVAIKSGVNMGCMFYAKDTNDGCYSVSGIGTSQLTVKRVGDGPLCQEISYIEVFYADVGNYGTVSSGSPSCNEYSASGFYEDSLGLHASDGYFHDSDEDRGGSKSTGYTCGILDTLSCGLHQVEVIITDKAGFVTTGSATIDNGDCDPPTTVDNAPAGWQNTDVTVTLTCTDAHSGCAATTYEMDAGATQYGNSVSLTTDGTHTITYRSTDNAGNIEADKTATVMIDKTAPSTADDAPAGWQNTDVMVTLTCTDATSGCAITTYEVDGGAAQGGNSVSLTTDGTHTITYRSTDNAGNIEADKTATVMIDKTAPDVTYISPVDTIYDTTNPTVTGTAADATSGVASASASIDGSPAIPCTVDGTGNVSCPTSGLAYGWHTGVITAQDAAGNTGSATSTFCISSGRPNLTLYKVKGPYLVPGDPYRWVTVDYRMDNSGPDAYNVRMMSMTGIGSNIPFPWSASTPTWDIPFMSPLPLPLMLGDIAPGGSVAFSVKYYWPTGTSYYRFTNTACAEDQCFTEYFYP